MTLVYFAFIREQIGISTEEIDIPNEVKNASDLIEYLETKGQNYKNAFAQDDLLRIAVNQEYVNMDHAITNDDEVAIFPPMTGG